MNRSTWFDHGRSFR